MATKLTGSFCSHVCVYRGVRRARLVDDQRDRRGALLELHRRTDLATGGKAMLFVAGRSFHY